MDIHDPGGGSRAYVAVLGRGVSCHVPARGITGGLRCDPSAEIGFAV